MLTRAAAARAAGPAVLPTGSVSLDILLGGGWGKGSVSELYGPPGSGTTTVALRTIAAAQRANPGDIAVMYDSSPGSGSRLPGYAARLGADLDRLIITGSPDCLPDLPRKTVITVIDGLSGARLPPRENLGATVLVIPRESGLIRPATVVRIQRSYGARWAWAELRQPTASPAPGRLPLIPVSLAAHAPIQEILHIALMYGLIEVHGKRWYYCGPRKFAGGWDDAVHILRKDQGFRETIISGIAAKTGLDGSNWLTALALCD